MDLNESWIQIASIFLANAALIVWFRAESRSDWRHMDNRVDAIQSEVIAIHKEVGAIREGVSAFHLALQKQDLEFKQAMDKRDAEFKTFLMRSKK